MDYQKNKPINKTVIILTDFKNNNNGIIIDDFKNIQLRLRMAGYKVVNPFETITVKALSSNGKKSITSLIKASDCAYFVSYICEADRKKMLENKESIFGDAGSKLMNICIFHKLTFISDLNL